MVCDALVKGSVSITTCDDHWQVDFLAKRLQRVFTEAAEIGLGPGRGDVLDTVLACGGTVGELVFCEVRGVHWVTCFLFHVSRFLNRYTLLLFITRGSVIALHVHLELDLRSSLLTLGRTQTSLAFLLLNRSLEG